MEVRLHASLHTKGLTGVSHLTLAYMMGWTYVRSVGRSVGRSYDDVITKISRMDGLPYFLSRRRARAELRYENSYFLCPLVEMTSNNRHNENCPLKD